MLKILSKLKLGKSARPTETAIQKNVIAKGRWVSTYDIEQGVLRRHISPRYGEPVSTERAIKLLEPLLYEITGEPEYSKLVFLVAPTTKPYFYQHKLHCFNADTMTHLGSTCITTKELQLMQQFEMLLKYEIIYTEDRISIKSLACSRAIIAKILQRNRDSLLLEEPPEPEPEPAIKSLRNPKIPVRLRTFDMNREYYVNKLKNSRTWRR